MFMPPPASQGSGTIELAGISLAQDGRTVLAGIDLSLSERRIGIIGRNGSGKSSLLRIIAGLQRPDAGDVRAFGVDVMRDRAKTVRTLGVVFQNPDHQIIFPTVEEEIAFGLTQLGQSRSDARACARSLLKRHGLEHWATRPTHALSQGQRQYLCLLSVLVMEPQVVLLDEPFASLDLLTRTQLFRSLSDLAPRLVMVTHDTASLAGFDRVLWLDEGRVRADGPPAAVAEQFNAEMLRLAEGVSCWR